MNGFKCCGLKNGNDDNGEKKNNGIVSKIKNVACEGSNFLCRNSWLPKSWCNKIKIACELTNQIEENWK